ncbi:hypothetical protein LJB89_04210, partial [Tyzzerella sp. OttesenSCG-928-J15]|nr:hypothetical protein [Tyzzerella sp. OttesenSCG-928-J15]
MKKGIWSKRIVSLAMATVLFLGVSTAPTNILANEGGTSPLAINSLKISADSSEIFSYTPQATVKNEELSYTEDDLTIALEWSMENGTTLNQGDEFEVELLQALPMQSLSLEPVSTDIFYSNGDLAGTAKIALSENEKAIVLKANIDQSISSTATENSNSDSTQDDPQEQNDETNENNGNLTEDNNTNNTSDDNSTQPDNTVTNNDEANETNNSDENNFVNQPTQDEENNSNITDENILKPVSMEASFKISASDNAGFMAYAGNDYTTYNFSGVANDFNGQNVVNSVFDLTIDPLDKTALVGLTQYTVTKGKTLVYSYNGNNEDAPKVQLNNGDKLNFEFDWEVTNPDGFIFSENEYIEFDLLKITSPGGLSIPSGEKKDGSVYIGAVLPDGTTREFNVGDYSYYVENGILKFRVTFNEVSKVNDTDFEIAAQRGFGHGNVQLELSEVSSGLEITFFDSATGYVVTFPDPVPPPIPGDNGYIKGWYPTAPPNPPTTPEDKSFKWLTNPATSKESGSGEVIDIEKTKITLPNPAPEYHGDYSGKIVYGLEWAFSFYNPASGVENYLIEDTLSPNQRFYNYKNDGGGFEGVKQGEAPFMLLLPMVAKVKDGGEFSNKVNDKGEYSLLNYNTSHYAEAHVSGKNFEEILQGDMTYDEFRAAIKLKPYTYGIYDGAATQRLVINVGPLQVNPVGAPTETGLTNKANETDKKHITKDLDILISNIDKANAYMYALDKASSDTSYLIKMGNPLKTTLDSYRVLLKGVSELDQSSERDAVITYLTDGINAYFSKANGFTADLSDVNLLDDSEYSAFLNSIVNIYTAKPTKTFETVAGAFKSVIYDGKNVNQLLAGLGKNPTDPFGYVNNYEKNIDKFIAIVDDAKSGNFANSTNKNWKNAYETYTVTLEYYSKDLYDAVKPYLGTYTPTNAKLDSLYTTSTSANYLKTNLGDLSVYNGSIINDGFILKYRTILTDISNKEFENHIKLSGGSDEKELEANYIQNYGAKIF